MPRVTVGVPTYNRADYLKDTLPFILNQSYKDFELLIVDDCSSDNTQQLIKSFCDTRIRYYKNSSNLNIPGNLNRILELSKGEYIVILHDHDIFDSCLLERMVSFLDLNNNVGFVYTGIAWIDPNGGNYTEMSPKFTEMTKGDDLIKELLLGKEFSSPINACGMVRRKAYEKVGFCYDEQFGFLSDVDMWLRIASEYDVGFIRQPLITCRRRDETHQYSFVNWQLIEWLLNIHRINIQRFFSHDESELHNAMKIWQRKEKRYCLKSLLAVAANGQIDSVKEGLQFISKQNITGWSNAANSLLPYTSIQIFFSYILKYANILRKGLSRNNSTS